MLQLDNDGGLFVEWFGRESWQFSNTAIVLSQNVAFPEIFRHVFFAHSFPFALTQISHNGPHEICISGGSEVRRLKTTVTHVVVNTSLTAFISALFPRARFLRRILFVVMFIGENLLGWGYLFSTFSVPVLRVWWFPVWCMSVMLRRMSTGGTVHF